MTRGDAAARCSTCGRPRGTDPGCPACGHDVFATDPESRAPVPAVRRADRRPWWSRLSRPPPWLVVAAAAIVVGLILVRFAVWVGVEFDPFAPETTAEGVRRLLREHRGSRGDVPTPDPDALIAHLTELYPEAAEQALRERVPLTHADDVHGVFDAFLAGLHAIDPRLAPEFDGEHRHLPPPPLDADVLYSRAALLARDTIAAVDATRPRSAHERTDLTVLRRRLLLGLIESEGSETQLLREVIARPDALVPLVEFACCAEADRAAVAGDALTDIATEFPQVGEMLENPPRPLVLLAIARMEDAGEYFDAYPVAWSEPRSTQLRGPAARAARAVRGLAGTLRRDVLPRAHGAPGMGRDRVVLTLRLAHGIETAPERLLEVAAELSERPLPYVTDSEAVVRALAASRAHATPATKIERLRELSDRVVEAPQPDSGIDLRAIPTLWRHDFGYAYHAGAPTDDLPDLVMMPPEAGNVPDDDADGYAVWYAAYTVAQNEHVLAHETYPGHHVQDEAAESACRLRRNLSEAFAVEGWAEYAVQVLHEVGACGASTTDARAHAARQAWHAEIGAATLALEMGLASPDEVVEWFTGAGMDELGVPGLLQEPLAGAAYVFGRLELLRVREAEQIRLMGSFRLRDFNQRVLRAGPVPAPLLGAELRD